MRLSYVILTALLVVLISGCNSYELESDRRDRDVTIDGDDNEWDESRFYIEKEGIVAGVMNDDEFLYVCIYPSNSQLSGKILRQGLTLWANAEGKKKKNYGIRFPLQTAMVDFKKTPAMMILKADRVKSLKHLRNWRSLAPKKIRFTLIYTTEMSSRTTVGS